MKKLHWEVLSLIASRWGHFGTLFHHPRKTCGKSRKCLRRLRDSSSRPAVRTRSDNIQQLQPERLVSCLCSTRGISGRSSRERGSGRVSENPRASGNCLERTDRCSCPSSVRPRVRHENSKAKTAYQDFLALWKDADSNILALKQAKAEYATLR